MCCKIRAQDFSREDRTSSRRIEETWETFERRQIEIGPDGMRGLTIDWTVQENLFPRRRQLTEVDVNSVLRKRREKSFLSPFLHKIDVGDLSVALLHHHRHLPPPLSPCFCRSNDLWEKGKKRFVLILARVLEGRGIKGDFGRRRPERNKERFYRMTTLCESPLIDQWWWQKRMESFWDFDLFQREQQKGDTAIEWGKIRDKNFLSRIDFNSLSNSLALSSFIEWWWYE